MPRSEGSIQICRKWTPSVVDGLNSLCITPRPALILCTSPGVMTDPLPGLAYRHHSNLLLLAAAWRRETAHANDMAVRQGTEEAYTDLVIQ